MSRDTWHAHRIGPRKARRSLRAALVVALEGAAFLVILAVILTALWMVSP